MKLNPYSEVGAEESGAGKFVISLSYRDAVKDQRNKKELYTSISEDSVQSVAGNTI